MPPSFKERLGVQELTDKNRIIWKALVAEFLGTLLLNFFGCGSCLNVGNPKAPADVVRIAFAFGLIIFATVQAFCHVSGAHLNPAVSLAFLITGKISMLKTLLYLIIQCVGATAGTALLKALTPDDSEIRGNLGATTVSPRLSAVQGFGVELLLGFALVLVVFAVCDQNRNLQLVAPLAVGLTVGMGHLTAVPLTGSGMNPARSFGSAVVSNVWMDHWVYWCGPIFGGIVAACIYECIFSAPPKASEEEYTPVHPEEREMSLRVNK